MKKRFSSKKSAFSLIELAIVLIIIGLLIAGITGGAALIKSAELRAIVTESRSNSVAVSAFYSLYDSLPGDSSTYTAATEVGNGDNKIEFCVASSGCDAVDAESEGGGIAWDHLITAGIVNIPGFTAVASDTAQVVSGSTPSLLPSKTKGAGWAFDYNATYSPNTNVTIMTTASSTDANLEASTSNAILLASDAFAVDTKNDDGKPNTGTVKATGGTTNCKSDATATTATYQVTTSTKDCALMFDLEVTGS